MTAAKKIIAVSDETLGGPGLSNADAKLTAELMRQIRHDLGHINSKVFYMEMIERSRPKRSPTHHLFEWDPTKAHETYLYQRAGDLFRYVHIIFHEAPKIKERFARIVTV